MIRRLLISGAWLAIVSLGNAAWAADGISRPDLSPGVTRTYTFETTYFPSGGPPGPTTLRTVELTTTTADDGTPVLIYRLLSVTGRESDLLRLVIHAQSRLPLELRLDDAGRPIGFLDWPRQRERMTEAMRQAGRELGIDTTLWEALYSTWSEADAMYSLIDEVRLLALIEGAPDDGATEVSRYSVTGSGPADCAVTVKRVGTTDISSRVQPAFRDVDRFRVEGTTSSIDGWALMADFVVETQPADGDRYSLRYVYRLINPPACPGTHP